MVDNVNYRSGNPKDISSYMRRTEKRKSNTDKDHHPKKKTLKRITQHVSQDDNFSLEKNKLKHSFNERFKVHQSNITEYYRAVKENFEKSSTKKKRNWDSSSSDEEFFISRYALKSSISTGDITISNKIEKYDKDHSSLPITQEEVRKRLSVISKPVNSDSSGKYRVRKVLKKKAKEKIVPIQRLKSDFRNIDQNQNTIHKLQVFDDVHFQKGTKGSDILCDEVDTSKTKESTHISKLSNARSETPESNISDIIENIKNRKGTIQLCNNSGIENKPKFIKILEKLVEEGTEDNKTSSYVPQHSYTPNIECSKIELLMQASPKESMIKCGTKNVTKFVEHMFNEHLTREETFSKQKDSDKYDAECEQIQSIFQKLSSGQQIGVESSDHAACTKGTGGNKKELDYCSGEPKPAIIHKLLNGSSILVSEGVKKVEKEDGDNREHVKVLSINPEKSISIAKIDKSQRKDFQIQCSDVQKNTMNERENIKAVEHGITLEANGRTIRYMADLKQVNKFKVTPRTNLETNKKVSPQDEETSNQRFPKTTNKSEVIKPGSPKSIIHIKGEISHSGTNIKGNKGINMMKNKLEGQTEKTNQGIEEMHKLIIKLTGQTEETDLMSTPNRKEELIETDKKCTDNGKHMAGKTNTANEKQPKNLDVAKKIGITLQISNNSDTSNGTADQERKNITETVSEKKMTVLQIFSQVANMRNYPGNLEKISSSIQENAKYYQKQNIKNEFPITCYKSRNEESLLRYAKTFQKIDLNNNTQPKWNRKDDDSEKNNPHSRKDDTCSSPISIRNNRGKQSIQKKKEFVQSNSKYAEKTGSLHTLNDRVQITEHVNRQQMEDTIQKLSFCNHTRENASNISGVTLGNISRSSEDEGYVVQNCKQSGISALQCLIKEKNRKASENSSNNQPTATDDEMENDAIDSILRRSVITSGRVEVNTEHRNAHEECSDILFNDILKMLKGNASGNNNNEDVKNEKENYIMNLTAKLKDKSFGDEIISVPLYPQNQANGNDFKCFTERNIESKSIREERQSEVYVESNATLLDELLDGRHIRNRISKEAVNKIKQKEITKETIGNKNVDVNATNYFSVPHSLISITSHYLGSLDVPQKNVVAQDLNSDNMIVLREESSFDFDLEEKLLDRKKCHVPPTHSKDSREIKNENPLSNLLGDFKTNMEKNANDSLKTASVGYLTPPENSDNGNLNVEICKHISSAETIEAGHTASQNMSHKLECDVAVHNFNKNNENKVHLEEKITDNQIKNMLHVGTCDEPESQSNNIGFKNSPFCSVTCSHCHVDIEAESCLDKCKMDTPNLKVPFNHPFNSAPKDISEDLGIHNAIFLQNLFDIAPQTIECGLSKQKDENANVMANSDLADNSVYEPQGQLGNPIQTSCLHESDEELSIATKTINDGYTNVIEHCDMSNTFPLVAESHHNDPIERTCMLEKNRQMINNNDIIPKKSSKVISRQANELLDDELVNTILTKNYERCMESKDTPNDFIDKLLEKKESRKQKVSSVVKKYRKGKLKIYRLKRVKKASKDIEKEENKFDLEDVFKKLTQDFQASARCSSPCETFVSTPSSYMSVDTLRSETLSSGSKDLDSPQKRLRKGFNKISKDKSLLHSENIYDNPNALDKDEIKMKIQDIFLQIFNDLTNGRRAALKFRRQCYENCVLKDGRLQLKPEGEALESILSSTVTRSRMNFKLVICIMKKIQVLLETNSKLTKRELYYQLKDMINGQGVVDRAINLVSCLLNVGMWALNIIAQKGLIFGNLKILLSSGETINCNVPGTLIPQDINDIVEIQSDAYFILVVEKEAIFQKLLEEDIPNKLTRPFIMITGKGFPDLNTQLFIRKLWIIMSIPVFIFVDADPHGINIMLNYRFGSVANAHVSHHLAVPKARWLGLFPSEMTMFNVKKHAMTTNEQKMVEKLLNTPYMKDNPGIVHELKILQQNNLKAGIEGLIKTDLFLSKVYLPYKFLHHNFI